MSAKEKSDLPEVAEKRADKTASAAAELVERRGGAKENAELQSTVWTQSREAVSQAQGRMAGDDRRSHVHVGRRPKAAKERTRGRWSAEAPRPWLWGLYQRGTVKPDFCGALLPCFCAFFCSIAPQAFFRPDRRFRTPARAEAVQVGRRSAIEAHFDVSRPRLDSFEHGGRLDGYGPEERSVVEFFLPLLCLLRMLVVCGFSVNVHGRHCRDSSVPGSW